MSEPKQRIEWKDARTHREPHWPFYGFAPGEYMSHCLDCDGRFLGMDKRALRCLPCAIDGANKALERAGEKVLELEKENATLRAAIKLVSEPTP